jgi:hypothetical protein
VDVQIILATNRKLDEEVAARRFRRLQPEALSGPRNPHTYLEDEEATYNEALRAFRKRLILDRLRRYGNSAHRGSSQPADFWPHVLQVLVGRQAVSLT